MVPPSSGDGITVTNRLEKSVVGVVRVSALDPGYRDDEFDRDLSTLISERAAALSDDLEKVRLEARNMLRNGAYKPTGRGKPASEYLLRAAQDPESFPRVNWPVDVCNFISLRYLMPISIWDVDAASTTDYVFRLGHPGEEYVFNTAGQIIAVQDLAVGCALLEDDSADGTPIVNPVKDSMRTKTGPSTRHVMAAVYAPISMPDVGLERACMEFANWLGRATTAGDATYRILDPGTSDSC